MKAFARLPAYYCHHRTRIEFRNQSAKLANNSKDVSMQDSNYSVPAITEISILTNLGKLATSTSSRAGAFSSLKYWA